MEIRHFSHEHPLICIEGLSRGTDADKAYCSGCGESLLGPSFSCVVCGFNLHNQCAEAPVEMNLSFHPNHSFTLLQKHPQTQTYEYGCYCDFCNKRCEHFVYHCSCDLDLHIKCALFLYNLAEKRMGQLEHIRRIDPLISTEYHGKELNQAKCFACWELLLDSEYLSPDCGFYLHTKCVDLPLEINHPLHHDHPLLLQFNKERLACDICHATQNRGLVYCCPNCKYALCLPCGTKPAEIHHFCHPEHPLVLKHYHEPEPFPCQVCDEKINNKVVYCCSSCEFITHIKCAPPPPTIQHKNHPHRFLLFKKRVSYICDACGTPGNHISYICPKAECNITVHRKCISLPRAIKFHRHRHRLFHKYFLGKDEVEMLECGVCHELVKTEHGSYSCSKCNYIVHVGCALVKRRYVEVDPIDIDETDEALYVAPYSRVSETSINHFSHHHDLDFSENIKEEKQCDGCLLFISTSYYYCSQCDFFLHESCAELSLKRHLWICFGRNPFNLTSSGIFQCACCRFETHGFAYYTDDFKHSLICLRCALVSDFQNCEGHEHPLAFFENVEAVCNACGRTTGSPYRCKRCDFNLHRSCLDLPLMVSHKSDMHLLRLTYGDNNDYSEYHYCDICEEKRNPNFWFYYCSICDTAVHSKCVTEKYSFIKPGSIYTKSDHSHSLTFVRKIHFYAKCSICEHPCISLALECKESGCGYIVHWKCINPS